MADRAASDFRGLAIRDLVIAAEANPITQLIAPGEIVGLAGLDGHGQEVFLKMLAGLTPPLGGSIELALPGASHKIIGFRRAVASGIAYLPRDRRANGIFPTQSVLDNFAVATLSRDTRLGLISPAARKARYEIYRERLSISAPRPDAPINTLSGGNQQKVLLARALALQPSILLLNDPTRGVDVATRHVLYDVFRGLAADGMGLIILSSEIEEILLLCGRVLVFRENEVAAEISGEAMNTDNVIAAMFGRAA
ncbi:ATP-binding cassette domain-containing protein [Mesorhizobium sp. B4-1-4]|uniref:ATP-binding cassette domain-containing protein n=1 Tax=Mesorhizobium sp. B4-1-4 TaxID=2589888 RepID=UPI001128F47D|nr:ATP-binding cassette domain-containing protein [Mesorhizobium sp. B4-1-4]UCI32334.1 ATP-binding cassette domain-containing protein [Mesorhizobium sp. B4-1-4]